MNLIQNITSNSTLIQEDFVGIGVSFSGIGQFCLHAFIALAVFVLFYLFGHKVRKIFFKENKKFNFFVNIALGYVVVGTGIALLGVFSLLQKEVIWGYLIVVVLFSLYPFRVNVILSPSGKLRVKNLFVIKSWMRSSRLPAGKAGRFAPQDDIVRWGVFLFVLIAFLRLVTPEIGEDGYHTDLPSLYLTTHTTMHEARDPLRVIPYPQLAEMTYLIPVSLGDKEATRFIHYGFYLLIVLLLFRITKVKAYAVSRFSPLLFVTAPIVIKYTSVSYIDFFMIFCFLLSILLLQEGSRRRVILAGILFGGAIATKLWLIIYMPAILIFIAYLHRRIKITHVFVLLLLFGLSSFLVAALWYIRDFLITGNPIYPVFSRPEYLEAGVDTSATHTNFFGFNWKMFERPNLMVLSPLFFFATIFFVLIFKKSMKIVKRVPLFVLFITVSLEQLITPNVYLGRHLLAWYTLAILILSAGLAWILDRSRMIRFGFIGIYSLLFIYYFINTVLILPYGFGWADRNAYLTRTLGRDNANYYDFDHLFGKRIEDSDLVATYGIVSYYYADFAYIDVNYIFSKNAKDFSLINKKGATKLLLKGGDIKWFCTTLSLTHCDKDKVKLLATWPEDAHKYNLYELK